MTRAVVVALTNLLFVVSAVAHDVLAVNEAVARDIAPGT